jgi:hypothetical protein
LPERNNDGVVEDDDNNIDDYHMMPMTITIKIIIIMRDS